MLSLDHLNALLLDAYEQRCTDVHIQPREKPLSRKNGELDPLWDEPVEPDDTIKVLKEILNPRQWAQFEAQGDIDFAYDIDGDHRFRVNAYRMVEGTAIAFRVLLAEILDFDVLGLPPVVKELSENPRGLILVTGVTGSGKTTTLATMLKHINQMRKWHILTIEDPIEFIHRNIQSLVSQREIGTHCGTFLEGLKYALRQDPDAILIGELRDQDTIRTAVSAAETGHLVLSTVHSSEAHITIDRILSFFQGEEQDQVRIQLSSNLCGVISQRLMPRRNGQGLVPVLEILVANSSVRKFIADGRAKDLKMVMQNGADGMQTFNTCLQRMVLEDVVSEELALQYSDNPAVLRRILSGGMAGGDRAVLLGA